MPAELGRWLREQREARGWTRPEMARQLIRAGHARGDKSMPGLDSMCHNLYRWERGANGISERYRLYCSEVLGIPPRQFETTPGPALVTEPARVARAATAGKLIVITITLPEDTEAQVRVTKHRDSPPPGTAG